MNVASVPWRPQPDPYPGARPFGGDDQRRFFGRSREAQELVDLWLGHRLTILHGDHGVGKTSLLRAGVIPRLASMAANVLPLGRTTYRSSFPRAALPEQNPYTFALLSSWRPADSPARISGLSISSFLHRQERTDRFGEPLPTLVAIDQLEQIFRDAKPYERQRPRFIEELADALARRPRTHLLVSVRALHLDEVEPIAKALDDDTACAMFRLHPFGRDAAIEAVARPLEATGRSFEPGAAGRLVDEVRTIRPPGRAVQQVAPAVDPTLLQVVCARLWEELPEDERVVSTRLTPDVDQALADFCWQVLSVIAADHDMPPRALASWLRGTFLTPLGDAAGVPENAEQIRRMAGSVIRSLEDQHLIRTRRRDGAYWYELQHRRLIPAIHRLDGAPRPVRQADPAARLRAVKLAMSEGELALAQRQAEAVTRSPGGDSMRDRAEAESFLGNIAYEQGRPDAAARHYRAAASMFETLQDTRAVGRLLAAVGRLMLAKGDRAAAVGELRAAARRAPNDLTVQTGLGQALWQAGQVKAALSVLNAVLTKEGDTPEALRTRGEILADLGDAESSLRDLERVDQWAQPSARAARALALAILSRFDAAHRELDGIVGKATQNGPLLFRAAQVQRLSGALDAAVELASRAVAATDPPLPSHQKTRALQLVSELRPLGGRER
jgi:hypothetical protein